MKSDQGRVMFILLDKSALGPTNSKSSSLIYNISLHPICYNFPNWHAFP